MKKLRVAIIGCGGIANQKHFPALKRNSDLKLRRKGISNNVTVDLCDMKKAPHLRCFL